MARESTASETSPAGKDHRQRPAPRHLPFLTLVLLILVLAYFVQGPVRSWLSGRYRAVSVFDKALRLVVDEYVEPVEPQEVLPGAIRGMVESLRERFRDTHSQYLPPKDNQRFENAEHGTFAGVGIVIRLIDGQLVIHEVLDDSPAAEAGLRPGDVIVAADGRDLTGIKAMGEAVDQITGPVGTEVTLTIQRGEERLKFTATRRELPRTVVEHRRIGPRIGYIRIADFPSEVSEKVADAIAALRADPPIEALILDVRGNGGGFLDEAVDMADLFIAKGVIVATRSRDPREDETYRAEAGGPAEDIPLVCLVDGYTASAAEVVAGALQDHGRATLLGTKTFGKGAVNKRFTFQDGSGMLLTTGKYFLPKGRQIEGKGIEPDVVVKPASKEDIQSTPAGAEFPDPQLDAAVERLSKP
jgi:carboxyl-terminal processing protease